MNAIARICGTTMFAMNCTLCVCTHCSLVGISAANCFIGFVTGDDVIGDVRSVHLQTITCVPTARPNNSPMMSTSPKHLINSTGLVYIDLTRILLNNSRVRMLATSNTTSFSSNTMINGIRVTSVNQLIDTSNEVMPNILNTEYAIEQKKLFFGIGFSNRAK